MLLGLLFCLLLWWGVCDSLVSWSGTAVRSAWTRLPMSSCSPPSSSDVVVQSLRNVSSSDSSVDWAALRSLMSDKLALPYKNWTETSQWADELERIIGNPFSSTEFCEMFERVLRDGNWQGAAEHARSRSAQAGPPWVVLVTGLNGIRKSTTLYQPWFADVLREALGDSLPADVAAAGTSALPTGSNSFFRQLDYMIAAVAIQSLAGPRSLSILNKLTFDFQSSLLAATSPIQLLLLLLLLTATPSDHFPLL